MTESASDGCIMFDDDQRVRILHVAHRKAAEDIVAIASEYQEALGEFDRASSYIHTQLEDVSAEAEAKRKFSLSLSMSIAAQDVSAAHSASVNLLKLSLQNAELESAKFETQALMSMQDTFKQTRTAIIELFGGQ
ncbi:Hypothetical protein GLP15_3193 [Giardia lamblia P15]|uniref:Uncharacterized protein n=1 Tax=Giardia intestinalis (strain P15) TaxID=658858 RepID=E1F973_GIAIA|nr:Hypothetical protein GLP15_3193 [Giardia lamblia P15]